MKHNHRKNAENHFNNVVRQMSALYNESITEYEAAEAARNLIGYCRVMLEVQNQRRKGTGH